VIDFEVVLISPGILLLKTFIIQTSETATCYGPDYKLNLTFGKKEFDDNISSVNVTITEVTTQVSPTNIRESKVVSSKALVLEKRWQRQSKEYVLFIWNDYGHHAANSRSQKMKN
jgi:hypothetical protein